MANSRLALLFLALVVGQGLSIARQDVSRLGQNGPPNEDGEAERLKRHSSPLTAEPLPMGAGALTVEQIKALIQEVADKDIENNKKQRNYTYVERQEQHHLDGNGALRSSEAKTLEVMMIYGEQVERLIAKNDRPLAEKEAAKEDEKIQKIIDRRKHESQAERRKRLEKEEKQREQDREFVKDISDAYNFRFVELARVEGRDTYIVDAEPRADFQPHHKDAKLLPKFRFRIWIDKQEKQWVKLDIACIDTVSWGLFIARIHKGSRILIETTRVNDEVWLPKYVEVKVDARVALLKNLNEEIDLSYRDYRKFRSDTRIVGVGEVRQEKREER
ncbi:MAG: hypothetical protein JO356_04485 [Acidobacteria bacterium]|nr:hypothetical protein [Acidobacteriota bacterium]